MRTREGNEKREESTLERPGGSAHEKATEGDEDMDREEVDVRNEEERTEAGSDKEAEGREAVTILAGPHGMFLFPIHYSSVARHVTHIRNVK